MAEVQSVTVLEISGALNDELTIIVNCIPGMAEVMGQDDPAREWLLAMSVAAGRASMAAAELTAHVYVKERMRPEALLGVFTDLVKAQLEDLPV